MVAMYLESHDQSIDVAKVAKLVVSFSDGLNVKAGVNCPERGVPVPSSLGSN
jgi:hypothetical protein